MISIQRLGATFLGALLVFGAASVASAGPLDDCRFAGSKSTLRVADPDLGFDSLRAADRHERLKSFERDAVRMGDLAKVEDFHPETDRWTEHNNRIRISAWFGGWFFSNELEIDHDAVIGLRIAWEVPGFIGIRWDSGFVGWSTLRVRGVPGTTSNRERDVAGVVHAHTLSLAIFNPELSIDGLAFWAGFGAGLWVYDYHENSVDFSSSNMSGNVFIELDYKIADIFHVGVGLRQHFLLATHTDDFQFADINGQTPANNGGRNDGILDDLAGVTELTLNFSILF
ncbi:MAG: hypothetical protein AB7N76_09065 [Planctomycetota bacterium]